MACGLKETAYDNAVSLTELHALPPLEKLKVIEALWSDLAANEETVPSPEWHAEALRQTGAEFAAGKIETLEWESAKKELRQRFE